MPILYFFKDFSRIITITFIYQIYTTILLDICCSTRFKKTNIFTKAIKLL